MLYELRTMNTWPLLESLPERCAASDTNDERSALGTSLTVNNTNSSSITPRRSSTYDLDQPQVYRLDAGEAVFLHAPPLRALKQDGSLQNRIAWVAMEEAIQKGPPAVGT